MKNYSFRPVKQIIIQSCIIMLLVITGCSVKKEKAMESEVSGEMVIFHAGSLSVPFHEIADSFKIHYPDINIKLEASGSVDAARKISDLGREADIMASADYRVIEKLLIPDHTKWLIKFAANEMAIAYDDDSKYAQELNSNNWFEVLLRDDVFYGRSDPDSDPCGYRSVLTARLAEKYYNQQNLAHNLLNKNKNFIRPKETDLLALLQSNAIDYIFLYRSVAEQHGLKYLPLPDSINLGNPMLSGHYKTAQVEITGKKPGKKIKMLGEPMVYGITIPDQAPNRKAAKAFLHFVLSDNKGLEIMKKNGQPSLVPAYSKMFEQIPEEFQKYVKANKPEN